MGKKTLLNPIIKKPREGQEGADGDSYIYWGCRDWSDGVGVMEDLGRAELTKKKTPRWRGGEGT